MTNLTDNVERAKSIRGSSDGVLMPTVAEYLVSQTFYPAEKCLEVMAAVRGFAEGEAADEVAEMMRLAIKDLGRKLQ